MFSCVAVFADDYVKGTIKNKSGIPINEVTVFTDLATRTQSNSEGFFSLNLAERFENKNFVGKIIIYLLHPKYKPLVKIFDINSETTIILEESNEQFIIPECNSSEKEKSSIGNMLRISLPKGTKAKKGFDVDYGYFSIKGKTKNVLLKGIYGVYATDGLPSEDWVYKSADFSIKVWSLGEYIILDVYGHYKNGNKWRNFGGYGEAIYYSNVPDNEAVFFDKLIDNICYKKPKSVK